MMAIYKPNAVYCFETVNGVLQVETLRCYNQRRRKIFWREEQNFKTANLSVRLSELRVLQLNVN